MASENETAESLIVQERDEKDIDRRNKPCNMDTAIDVKEHAGYENELQIEGTKGDEQIEPNLIVAKVNAGECFLYPPSVEKVAYEDDVRVSEDCPEEISEDANNQQVYKKIVTTEEAGDQPTESPRLDKDHSTCDPEKCLERTVPCNPPTSPGKFQETVSEADDLDSTSSAVVQGPKVMAETEKEKSMKDGDEKTTSSEVEDSNKSQISSSPIDGNKDSTSDIMKNVKQFETSLGESNDIVEEKKGLYEAEIDCNLKEASKSLSEKDVDDMTRSCETLNSKLEVEDKNIENNTESQGEEMDKGIGENSIDDTFSSNIESGINIKGPLQTTTMKPEECIVKEMMTQERKKQEIQDKAFTLTSESTEAVEPIKEISFSMKGKTKSCIANSKHQKDDIDTSGVRNCDTADIDQDITTEPNLREITDFRENNISKREDDVCLGYNTVAKVERDGKHDLDFELQAQELEKRAIKDSSHEKFYDEQASEVSENTEFTSSDRTAYEEIERKGVGHATNVTMGEGVPEVLKSEAEERQEIKIQEELTEELTEAETKHMDFDSNLQESSIASTDKISSLIKSMGKDSTKGEQLSDKFIDNGTAEEGSNTKQDIKTKNEANDSTDTSTSANLSVKSMDSNEREEATMEVDIYTQEDVDTVNIKNIASADEGVKLNDAIEKLDSCTKADSACEKYVTSEEIRKCESSIDTKEQYAISTETLLQKVYDEDQVQCNVKTGRLEAEDSKRKLEEGHEVSKEHNLDEPQSITKETVQENVLNALMSKKADAKEFETESSYPPRQHDDSSMQVFEVQTLERCESNEIQEVEEFQHTRFEENSERAEGNHESIKDSKSQNAPINIYNDGTQVAEAEDKADSHENEEDEKLYNGIINVPSKLDTNKKSNSIEEQSNEKTQAQTGFIGDQDTGVNHEDIVRKRAKESATCIEKQEQEIFEESTSIIEVENHVPIEERLKISHKDVQVNETEELAMEKQQCCAEGDHTSNITNGAPSYEIRGVDSIEGKWNFENIAGDSDQDMLAKSDSIKVLQDDKTHEQIGFNEISETKEVDNETIMNQSSEESNSYCAKQEQESDDACTSSPLKEVKQLILSTDECTKISSEDIEESEPKEEAIDKQIKDPDMVIRGFQAQKDRDDEIQPKNENSMNKFKEGKIEEIIATFGSIQTQKEAETSEQTCSNEIKETKAINNEIVNQSSEESDSCSSGKQDQESAQVSTLLTEDENPVPCKDIHTESSNTDSQASGIEIEASTEEQHCGAEDPDVITNGVSSNKDMIAVLQITELQKDEKTIEETGSNVINETKPANNEDLLTQQTKAVHTLSGNQDEIILETSIPNTQVKSNDPSKDECTRISGEELHEVTFNKQQCKSGTETVNSTTAPENKNCENILENDIKAQSHSFEESEDSRTFEQICFNETLEKQVVDNEEIVNRSSEDSDSCIVNQDQEASQTSTIPLVETASHAYKDKCLKISSGENHDSGDVGEASVDKEQSVDLKNVVCSDDVWGVVSEQKNADLINIVEDASQDKNTDSHSMEAQKDEDTYKHLGSIQIQDIVNQKSEMNNSDEESIALIKAETTAPKTQECTQISSGILGVKEEENIEKSQCSTEEHNKITNGVSSNEFEGVEIEQNENFVTIINGSQDINAELESNERQAGHNEMHETKVVSNENEGHSSKESNRSSGTHDQEIAEATTQLIEAQGPFPSMHENTRISKDEIELGEVDKEQVTQDPNETRYVASSYFIREVEIVPATESSIDTVEDNDQELNNEENGNQCFEDSDFACGKQDEEIVDESISLIGVQHLVRSNDECTKISSDKIQLKEVEEASPIGNQQCDSETKGSNEIENRVSSYDVDREEVVPENEISMNRVTDVSQDTDADLHKLEEQTDDNTQGHIGLNEIHKTEAVNNKNIEDQSTQTNEFSRGKQDQKISDVSRPIIEAENHGPSIDSYTTVSGEQFHVSIKEEPAINCLETKDPHKTRNGVCLNQKRRREIVSGNDNSIDIMEDIDQGIHPESNIIEAQKHENTHEQTTIDEIKEIHEVNNDEIKNKCTKESDSYNGEHDQELTEASATLGEAENPIPSKDEFTRISNDKIQSREVKDAAPIDKQQCYSETKEPKKIDDDVSSYKVEEVAHVPDTICQVKKELELHGYTNSDLKQCIEDDKVQLDSNEVQKDDKTPDNGIYEAENVSQEKVANQCSGDSNPCIDKQDQEIAQASIPIIEAEYLAPSIDKCTSTCEDIKTSEVEYEAMIGNKQCSTEMEDLNKNMNGVSSYKEKSMDTVDNACEQKRDRNANMQINLQDQQHENQLQLTESDEIAKSNSQETVPPEDMGEALDTSTTVEIQQANWQMRPQHVEEHGNLSAKDDEVIIDSSELKQDSRYVSSEEINAKLSTEKLELNDAEKEVTFPSLMNVHMNCQEVNNTEVSQNFPENETREPNQTASCKNLEEIQETTKPVTELEVKEDEKSSEKQVKEICLPEVEQREHKVPSLNDEPIKYLMPKQELGEKSKTTGESTAEPEDSLEFEVINSTSLNSSLEFEDEPIKDTMQNQELAEKGQATGDLTAEPEGLSSGFEGKSSISDSKTHTEPMSYSDCSSQTILTRDKGKDSNISLETPIVSPPIDADCRSSSKADTKYHDQTESSLQASETYGEELTETNEAHQKMHYQTKSSQPIAEARSLPDFGAHKATRNEDTHDTNTVTEETNASVDSKIFEGEATMESYQKALSEITTDYQVNSMDTVDIAFEQTRDKNSETRDNFKDVKHEHQSEPTAFKETDGSNSHDTFLQAHMAEALDVTTTMEIQQANTCQMFPPHVEELENLTAQDTEVITEGSELNQDSRNLSSKEINANHSTEKLELDDTKSAVTFPNSMDVHMNCQDVNATVVNNNFSENETKEPLQRPPYKNIEVIQGTRKPVIELEGKADENSSKKQEQETHLPEEEEKESNIPRLKDDPIKESIPKQELAEKGSRTGEPMAEPEDLSLEFVVHSSVTLNSTIEFKDEPIKDSRAEQELAESGQTTGCGPSSKVSGTYPVNSESPQQVSEPHGEELTETNETNEKMDQQLTSSQLIAEERSSPDFEEHEATTNEDKHDKTTVLPYDPILAQQNMQKTETLYNEEKEVVEEEQDTNTELINPSVNGGAAVSTIGRGLNGNLDSEEVNQIKDRKEDGNTDKESIVTEKGIQLKENHNELSASSELQDPYNNVSMEKASEELVDGKVDIGEKRQLQDDSREEPEEQEKIQTCTQKGGSVIELGRNGATPLPLKDPAKESLKEPTTDNPSSIVKDESREHVHREVAHNEPMKTQARSNTLDSTITLASSKKQESSAQTNLMVSDMTAQQKQVILHKEPIDEGRYALVKSKYDWEKHDEQEDSDLNVPLISDMELKATHKKSHNILLGVGSKVKNSISKVKKAMACTTSEFAAEAVIIKLNKNKNTDKA